MMDLMMYIPIVTSSILLVLSSIGVLYLDNGKREGYLAAFWLTVSVMLVSLLLFLYSLLTGNYNYALFSSTLYITPVSYTHLTLPTNREV